MEMLKQSKGNKNSCLCVCNVSPTSVCVSCGSPINHLAKSQDTLEGNEATSDNSIANAEKLIYAKYAVECR